LKPSNAACPDGDASSFSRSCVLALLLEDHNDEKTTLSFLD